MIICRIAAQTVRSLLASLPSQIRVTYMRLSVARITVDRPMLVKAAANEFFDDFTITLSFLLRRE